MHTDQGRNFESELIKEICTILGIQKTRTTPYHPQSNGFVERFNRTLLNMLSTICKEEEHWDMYLQLAMITYRTSVQETTGISPYSLMFGPEATVPIDLMFPSPDSTEELCSPTQYAKKLKNKLIDSYRSVRKHKALRQEVQKNYYNQREYGTPFKLGEQVWLHSPVVKKGKSRKFHCPWSGPFIVIKVISDVVYRIKDSHRPKKRMVVHFNRLKRCKGRSESLVKSNLNIPGGDDSTSNSDLINVYDYNYRGYRTHHKY